MSILARLAVTLYLVSSALAAFDRRSLSTLEIAVRLIVAVLIMFHPLEIYLPAAIAGLGLIGIHVLRNRTIVPA